ncbi:MAG TPA: N-acetylmuramoyl-L-alanine amidase [Gemmatimonadaceae bacterium]|nr:N-acetylmuramoyl-L-alanine amidase [Gemmatimonadaceae bacterium]
MITTIFIWLQAAVIPASVISARAGTVESVAPVVETTTGRAVRLDRLSPALPIVVRDDGPGRFVVAVFDVAIALSDQVPYARIGTSVIPLGGSPVADRNGLLVPLQVVSELLPRLLPSRLAFDPVRNELRVTAPAPAPRSRTRRRVVVDAGHGGPDNGMTGPIGGRNKIREKDITLAVSLELARSLRRRGVEVTMTRTRDTLIGLYDRGPIANEAGGDLFLSIHVNAANMRWRRPGDARGFETYFLAEAKTEDERRVERMENEAIRFETAAQAPKDDPLSFIIHDMAQNEHLRESQELAAAIQDGLGKVHPGPSRGVKQAGFVVLTTAFMPAVLVEIGFGTNVAEARYLASTSRQREIAEAIADATMQYLERYERRLGSAGR